MNTIILNTVIQDFINDNLRSNISSLLLKGMAFEGVQSREIITQIEAKNKCKGKLPTWYHTKNIYYPNKLNIEQTSSEITAHYKSQLVSGNAIIDLTGGFGVDSYYYARHFKSVLYCEINEELSGIATYNYKQLGCNNIITKNVDGIAYLRTTTKTFDWIYIDPSRRHDTKGKVFFLKDCLPNVPEHIDLLFNRTNNLLIKTAPLLDISIGIKELKYVKSIHIIAVNNDVKEMLWILENGFNSDNNREGISIDTVNIKKENKEHFHFKFEDETNAEVTYSLPRTYLYEPNSAILKAGAFKSVSQALKIDKLHKHSHLYTSIDLISFPGRSFKIIEILPYNKNVVRNVLSSKQANISVRNFPETVNTIKKKFNILDGGKLYVFFTINLTNEKIVIITSKTE